MSQRTFLALDLEEATIDRLLAVQRKLDDPGAGIRWVDRDNLHLTLIFLGDVPDEGLSEVCELSAAAAGLVQPFEYGIRGVECVPPAGPLRMIWAGVEDPTGRLAELQDRLRTALTGLGLHEETRSFHPHITLARAKSGKSAAAVRQAAREDATTDFGVQFAQEVVVYGSRLTPEGPVYTPSARARLGQ
jgi:RNA 2',3'-cyclic 3'-phosphodiesterase